MASLWKLSRARRQRLRLAAQGLPVWLGIALFLPRFVGLSTTQAVVLAGVSGLVISLVVDFAVYRVLAGLEHARAGTREQRLAVARANGIGLDGIFRKAVNAMEAGELELAARILARTAAEDAEHSFTRLAENRLTVLRGPAASRDRAIDALLAWQPPAIFASDEIERYHAYALARSLAGEAGSARVARAAERLLAHEDAVVRAYGTWLTLHAAPDDEVMPRVRIADPMKGAELARAAGEAALAEALETQVAREAESPDAPYRRQRQRQR